MTIGWIGSSGDGRDSTKWIGGMEVAGGCGLDSVPSREEISDLVEMDIARNIIT